ncbi:MAG: 1-deoxy-D-xylulose-5-phosphate synthase [Candidatus Nanopelagicales bacterium]
MTLLDSIDEPADVRSLTAAECVDLAAEIRAFLVAKVSRTGGHLGPNLGVVELTIGLHRVFDSPRDVLLWDTGHQAYVHKILTGRRAAFDTLRQAGGLSGYPSRRESEHDHIENSHASTSLSWADGVAKGLALQGELAHSGGDRHVVGIIGDGALTGGMAWEALNNIAGSDRQVVIVVNDNTRSYSPTIGGLANHLYNLRATDGYEKFLDWGKDLLGRTPVLGPPIFDALHGVKKGIKDIVAPQGMFEDLGLKYLGPVDGHDVAAVEVALRAAKGYPGPVIVQVITDKGHGYEPAKAHEADHFHAVGVIDPDTGSPLTSGGTGWGDIFGDEIVAIGRERPDVVAITAAMLGPTGLGPFAAAFPDRVFDVGIAEQHAVTSAAGLCLTGLHPVVAVYATFLNRAFDQVLMDVALHNAPVTFVLDRAGVTGEDGASHHGMWDLSLLNLVPGLRIAAPRDEQTLRAALRQAVSNDQGPTMVRYPKGRLAGPLPVVTTVDEVDVLVGPGPNSEVLFVAIGPLAAPAVTAATELAAEGIAVTVVSPVWIKPVPEAVLKLAETAGLVLVVEDNGRVGGFGSLVTQAMQDAGIAVPVHDCGVPQQFLDHQSRQSALEHFGLTGPGLAAAARSLLAEQTSRAQPGDIA